MAAATTSRLTGCFQATALPPRCAQRAGGRCSTHSMRCAASPSHHRPQQTQQSQQQQDASVLLMKTLAHTPLPTASTTSCSSSQLPLLACTLLATAALASACAPPSLAQDLHTSTSSIVPLFDLSEGQQEFWGNVARYGRYFVTVMLGTGYVMLRPFTSMFTKNPASALLAVGLLVGAVVGTKFTLELMLGMQSGVEYNAGNF